MTHPFVPPRPDAPAEDEGRALFLEAVDLAICLQDDPGNPMLADAIRSWIGRGPRHRAAWDRVAAIHGMAGKVMGPAPRASEGRLSRRNLMLGGVVGLGAAAAGGWFGPGWLLWAQADHLTDTAEIREIPLPDGSRVTLGPDSAIALDWTDKQRGILLLQGVAYFDVAPNPRRPFIVRAGETEARALGTAFEVSDDLGFVSVSVARGLVRAQGAGLPQDLAPGDWLAFAPNAVRVQQGHRDATEVAAWRNGMLVADHERVDALVARIGRWQGGRVVITDSTLAEGVVSGIFDLRHPRRALDAVVRPFGGKVRQVTPLLTVISRI